MTESTVNATSILQLSRDNIRLFRNNVGALPDRRGRLVRYGLAKGSGDLIGWREHVITAADVGKTVAVFTSFESKGARYQVRDGQEEWQNAVRTAGGIAAGIQSSDAAAALFRAWHPGFDWRSTGPWLTLTKARARGQARGQLPQQSRSHP